ncbi:MAG: NADP-dependent malic enzyme [Candidatus Kapaibacterium sp.]
MKIRREDALEYHSSGKKGKIEVITTKPCVTQRDLSLAYTPGVAEPCREIEKDPETAFEYTAKGNLVAVISNGTAVLGLGDIGALAGKPVMEGKGVLFKTFADIDVFDIELDSKNVDEIIRTIEIMAPTFGGINLEDIAGPDCFVIENELKKKLDIPVFHDDQHGTAIISGAALLNAVELSGKKIEDMKVVYSGAGASGIACARFHISLGVNPDNVLMCDSKGVLHHERDNLNDEKMEFMRETSKRSLADALEGADCFIGLSQGGIVSQDMIRRMADDPIIFAMANPDPEITYDDAVEIRPDAVMATGRSDFPNQVNNVLGFPFIFRGALDVHATAINEEMKIAAAHALAKLAKEEVPESVKRAYDVNEMEFGREYIIPKPFDPRVLTHVAPAVAKAAMDTGVARKPIEDFEIYKINLDIRMGRAQTIMRRIFEKAGRDPKRVVFPEGEHPKIIKAAQLIVDEGIAKATLLGNEQRIRKSAADHNYDIDEIEIIDPRKFDQLDEYIDDFYSIRQRKGVTLPEAENKMKRNKNYFGAMMVRRGLADAMLTGLTSYYPDALRPALEVIGREVPEVKVSGLYVVIANNKTYFMADTTVIVDPTPEEIADIACHTVDFAKNFEIDPGVALLSYSNFGSAPGQSPGKMARAREIIQQRRPELIVEGEMQANTALSREMLESEFPFSLLKNEANVLIFPDLNSGNIAYKLLHKIGKATIIGPVLQGLAKSVHVLQRSDDINDIVNMAAIAVVDAQQKENS